MSKDLFQAHNKSEGCKYAGLSIKLSHRSESTVGLRKMKRCLSGKGGGEEGPDSRTAQEKVDG